jgi:hypothetical protein
MRLDRAQGVKGHTAQSDNEPSWNRGDGLREEFPTLSDLTPGRGTVSAVAVERVAEDGIGDEDTVATEAGQGQELFEPAAGFVAA